MGRGGRGSVGRAGMFAGRFSVSDRQRVDDGAKTPLPELRPVASGWSDGLVKEAAYGKSVWFWHPWLVSSWRRFSLTQPGSQNRQFAGDGGKRNSSPGRARHKPSNHCAGKAGCSPLDLYARVRTSLCHCTRDRGCSAHPVFPAPSFGRELRSCLGRIRAARSRNCIHRHCERSDGGIRWRHDETATYWTCRLAHKRSRGQ